MRPSRRSEVPPFAVMEVLSRAKAMAAAGRDVLVLCVGEPGSGAPAVVRQRASLLALSGDLGYTQASGLPELRIAIAGHYRRWYELEVDPARIAVTTGSSGGFQLAFLAAFDAGDRVALARPGYPAYRNILTALGLEAVELPCRAAERYQPTVEGLEREHHRRPLAGLVVASPANPTGTALSAAGLDELARWCNANGVRLISDEIYHGTCYSSEGALRSDPGAPTAAGDERAIVVNSFSKFWGMTGWRLGWLVLPPELVGPVDALAGNLALCPPALGQQAALAAFTEEGYAAGEAATAGYARARALLLDRLGDLGWDAVAPADGAFYLYGRIASSGLNSPEYCRLLLAETGVALTPGTDFDGAGGDQWVRLSYSPGLEVVSEAIDRIAAWRLARESG